MTTTITESTATAQPTKGGRMLIQLITPGTGSSGVYSPEVLEAAAGAGVFPAGTLMFADHPSASDDRDRPERSIRDVAGVLTENARWDGNALVAEARTYEPWSSVLSQMHDAIGVSIRASARVDEADGDGRPVIAELIEGMSVDFVTYPGRGGAIREVYESKRPPIKIVETLPGGLVAHDLEQRLDDALGTDAWVDDFTDEWVVYRAWDGDERHLVQQTYTTDDQGRITLTGTPHRVARRVTYDAQNLPSTSAGIAERKEPTMAQIQIDEAEHQRLTEAADKVAAVEAEKADAVKRAEEAEAKIAAANEATDKAHVDRIIAAADADFTALEAKGLRADLPKGEDGRLDVTAFEKAVTEAAAEKREHDGEGRPTGVGAVNESTYSQADYDRDLGIVTKEA